MPKTTPEPGKKSRQIVSAKGYPSPARVNYERRLALKAAGQQQKTIETSLNQISLSSDTNFDISSSSTMAETPSNTDVPISLASYRGKQNPPSQPSTSRASQDEIPSTQLPKGQDLSLETIMSAINALTSKVETLDRKVNRLMLQDESGQKQGALSILGKINHEIAQIPPQLTNIMGTLQAQEREIAKIDTALKTLLDSTRKTVITAPGGRTDTRTGMY